MAKYRNELRSTIELFKALGDESRVRALLSLKGQELCVCQITELLGLAPSTVSKHMSVLKRAGLVESRKEGRWIYYRLADYSESPDSAASLEMLFQAVSSDSRIREDALRLKDILKMDPEELCRNQCKC